MSAVLGILAAVLVAVGAASRRSCASTPRSLPSGLRLAGPAVLGIAGVRAGHHRPRGLGGMLLSGAVAWYGLGRAKGRGRNPGQRSTVRTAALEMELDHDTGGLEGLVLAGRHEQKTLGSMS